MENVVYVSRTSNLAEVMGLSSAICKIIKDCKERKGRDRTQFPSEGAWEEGFDRLRSFFGVVLAGSWEMPKEEYIEFLLEGREPDLHEGASTHGYARGIWSSMEFRKSAPFSRDENFLDRIKSYLRCINILEEGTEWEKMSWEDKIVIEELLVFASCLGERARGDANSLMASRRTLVD